MEIHDLAIKYKALYQKAETMISNVEEIGFDVSELKEILQNIGNEVNNSIKTQSVEGFARASYEIYYSTGINKLNKFIVFLEKYNVYFQVLNSCKWLSMRIKDDNVTEQELKQYVSEMAYNLKLIVRSDTMDYDNEKHIVKEVYLTAYNIIKLELIMTGESMLYRFALEEDINSSYFNTIIKNDLKKINIDDKKNSRLKEKLFEIRKNGINSDYFDIDVIRMIVLNDKKIDCQKAITKKIDTLVDGFKENSECITSNVRKLTELEKDEKRCCREININKKIIREKLISFILTASILIGVGSLIPTFARKRNMKDMYLKKSEIYSTIDDTTTETTKEVYLTETPDKEVTVKVYDERTDDKRRGYLLYDVSSLDFEEASEYYDYGTSNYGVKPSKGRDRSSDGDVIADYQGSYTEVTVTTYDYIAPGFDEESYKDNLLGFYLIYLFLLVIPYEMIYTINMRGSIFIGNIGDLIQKIKKINNEKDKYSRARSDFKKVIEILIDKINENDELREKFNQLYESNKYLLSDPEELSRRVDKIINSNRVDEAKRLVRENKDKLDN